MALVLVFFGLIIYLNVIAVMDFLNPGGRQEGYKRRSGK